MRYRVIDELSGEVLAEADDLVEAEAALRAAADTVAFGHLALRDGTTGEMLAGAMIDGEPLQGAPA